MPFRQLMKSPYQYFKNRNGIFLELKLNLRWEQWSNILIWQLFENLPENRKARKFNVKWLTNHEWLDYNESNNIMTCKICTKHSSCQTSSNLTNTNKFLTGCTNFRISTIEDHGPCKRSVTNYCLKFSHAWFVI
jgi:hypothetical protein